MSITKQSYTSWLEDHIRQILDVMEKESKGRVKYSLDLGAKVHTGVAWLHLYRIPVDEEGKEGERVNVYNDVITEGGHFNGDRTQFALKWKQALLGHYLYNSTVALVTLRYSMIKGQKLKDK